MQESFIESCMHQVIIRCLITDYVMNLLWRADNFYLSFKTVKFICSIVHQAQNYEIVEKNRHLCIKTIEGGRAEEDIF